MHFTDVNLPPAMTSTSQQRPVFSKAGGQVALCPTSSCTVFSTPRAKAACLLKGASQWWLSLPGIAQPLLHA